ncbi:uncharacterized protein LOC143126218 [Alosa pseudoharengus]|uniref:uncharacterized protein LOC143126218 n=1 Tax=Alosa pseudoharengus TaxID=34774 RepID=UPI003F8A63B2
MVIYNVFPMMPLIKVFSLLLLVTGMDTKVHQSPSTLKLTEGESAQIQCCLDLSESPIEKMTWSWWRNGQKIDGQAVKETCPILIIESVQTKDSGLYVCIVYFEIPILRKENGTGTQLIVTPLKREDKHGESSDKYDGEHGANDAATGESGAAVSEIVQEDVIVIVLRCLPFVTLLMVSCYLSRDGKKGKSKVQQVKRTPTHVQEEAAEESVGKQDEGEADEGEENRMERGICQEEEDTGAEKEEEERGTKIEEEETGAAIEEKERRAEKEEGAAIEEEEAEAEKEKEDTQAEKEKEERRSKIEEEDTRNEKEKEEARAKIEEATGAEIEDQERGAEKEDEERGAE